MTDLMLLLVLLPGPDAHALAQYHVDEPWSLLADCESGDRDRGGNPIEGSARWWWGDPGRDHPAWGSMVHAGGLQWAEQTWSWLAPEVLGDDPPAPWEATPVEEVAVAERLLEVQGPSAWPTCGPMVGLGGGS